MNTIFVKCNNPEKHTYHDREKGEGNILLFMNGNKLYVKCSNQYCKRWNEISINIPGVTLDFSKATFTQELKPKGHKFMAKDAMVVIKE